MVRLRKDKGGPSAKFVKRAHTHAGHRSDHRPPGELSKDNFKFRKDIRDEKKIQRQSLDKKSKKTPLQESAVETDSRVVPKNLKSHLVAQPIAKWYESVHPLEPQSTPLPTLNSSTLADLTARASSLHAKDTETFHSLPSSSLTPSSGDVSFLHKILQSGTLSDRLSALTLLVQSSPVHNTKALDTLKSMAERGKGKGGREESLKALRCVVDWWVGGGVPDRKLKYFRDQPLTHPSVTDEHLLLWHFEDWLKKYFFSVLQILEVLSLDPLSYVRTQLLSLLTTLLRDKPEQEQNLLRLLVNKLGDTDKTVCSRVSYHLLQLLQTHPSMKSVIVREVTSLVLRPPAPTSATAGSSQNKHIRFDDGSHNKSKMSPAHPKKDKTAANAHARYYAAVTFNQIVLSPAEKQVARQLIEMYFEIFKEVLGEGAHDSEEVDAQLSGDSGVVKLKEGKGKAKAKAKKEIKGEAGFAEVESEHSRLVSAILTGVNRALPFAKVDSSDSKLGKHIDTLFLITHTSTFNISLQALVLIQHICASLSHTSSLSSGGSPVSESLIDRYYRTLYASLHDTRLASSSKQAMYLNLLFKSLKSDTKAERVGAFVRRFVQLLAGGGVAGAGVEFIVGGLYLLGELFSTIPGLKKMFTVPPSASNEKETAAYDPKKRDPQFAHASASPLWELTPLLHHYHPAVALHTRQLLAGLPITASADLSLNTLSHFLDRFVYKNPKKPRMRGESAMQPGATDIGGGNVRLVKGEVSGVGLNEEKLWERRKEDVAVDEVFFWKFFVGKKEQEEKRERKAGKRKGKGDAESVSSDDEEREEKKSIGEGSEVDSDDEEAEIWKAMKATMPKVAGDDDLMDEGESDGDEIPSGLDDEDTDDEDGFSLAEASDNEDLVDLDADAPADLIEYDGSDADEGEEEEEWMGFSGNTKRKRDDKEEGRGKKLRALPAFASYEDYARMIEDGPEDDV